MVIKTLLGLNHCAYDSEGTPWRSKGFQIKYCQSNTKENALALARKIDIKIVKWVKE